MPYNHVVILQLQTNYETTEQHEVANLFIRTVPNSNF